MDIENFIATKDIIVLMLGGVLGYLINIMVAKQTDKKRGLTLQTTGRRIIVESASSCPFVINDLNGNQLDNVYLINIRLWNKGKQHVERKDISREHPLRIHFDTETEILGEPIIFQGSNHISLETVREDKNSYRIDFECVNHDEWAEMGFFVKDNPNVNVTASGRIYGQNSNFNLSIDDSRAGMGTRLITWLFLILLVLSPLSLIAGLIWLFSEYSLSALINANDTLPDMLKRLLIWGILLPLVAISGYAPIWFKRRVNPQSYLLDEDFAPGEAKNIGALWGTALHGKNYRVSDSSRNNGDIVVPNSKRSD